MIGAARMNTDTSKDLQQVAKKLEELITERDGLIVKATHEGSSLRAIGGLLGINHVTVKNILARIDKRKC